MYVFLFVCFWVNAPQVFDWDRVGEHDRLGRCVIPAATLRRPPRVRNEFPLLDPEGGASRLEF